MRPLRHPKSATLSLRPSVSAIALIVAIASLMILWDELRERKRASGENLSLSYNVEGSAASVSIFS